MEQYRGYAIFTKEEGTGGWPAIAYIAESEAIPALGGAYVAGFSDRDVAYAIETVTNALDILAQKGVIDA